MNYTLSEAAKKRLTEKLLGECWHEEDVTLYLEKSPSVICKCRCLKCGKRFWQSDKRSFTVPDDRQALCEKLMENGQWERFAERAITQYMIDVETDGFAKTADIMYYLLIEQPERFCWLCDSFIQERIDL
jgi:hypothetical protein